MAKTQFNMTDAEFLKLAQALVIQVGDQKFAAGARKFNSGSLGWYANGKILVMVGETPAQVQVGLTLTVVGSKPAERPNLNEVRQFNGKAPIELDATGHAPAPKAPVIKKGKKTDAA